MLSRKSKDVFIVDDDPAICKALARVFAAAGYETQTFISAQELLDRHVKCPDGCLLLDVHMPGMDGPTLHQHLQSLEWKMPVIYITGREFRGGRARARTLGALDLLFKPIDVEALVSAVESALTPEEREEEA